MYVLFLVRKPYHYRYSPSSRVTAAERKLRLVNDKDARPGFTENSVQCARCDANVALEGDGDYNLTNWELHKSRCPK